MVCTQLLKGTREQMCPTHSHAQQGRQIAERVTAMLKFSKEEKVHIRDLSGSEQPKIMMHQVQGSFRVRFPQKSLEKSMRAERVPVPSFPHRGNRRRLLVVPPGASLGKANPPCQGTAQACLVLEKQALGRLRMWIAGTRRTAPSGPSSSSSGSRGHEPSV